MHELYHAATKGGTSVEKGNKIFRECTNTISTQNKNQGKDKKEKQDDGQEEKKEKRGRKDKDKPLTKEQVEAKISELEEELKHYKEML